MISRPAVQHGTYNQSESENYYFHIYKTHAQVTCNQQTIRTQKRW